MLAQKLQSLSSIIIYVIVNFSHQEKKSCDFTIVILQSYTGLKFFLDTFEKAFFQRFSNSVFMKKTMSIISQNKMSSENITFTIVYLKITFHLKCLIHYYFFSAVNILVKGLHCAKGRSQQKTRSITQTTFNLSTAAVLLFVWKLKHISQPGHKSITN